MYICCVLLFCNAWFRADFSLFHEYAMFRRCLLQCVYGHNFIGCNFVLACVAHSVENSISSERKRRRRRRQKFIPISFFGNVHSLIHIHAPKYIYTLRHTGNGRDGMLECYTKSIETEWERENVWLHGIPDKDKDEVFSCECISMEYISPSILHGIYDMIKAICAIQTCRFLLCGARKIHQQQQQQYHLYRWICIYIERRKYTQLKHPDTMYVCLYASVCDMKTVYCST